MHNSRPFHFHELVVNPGVFAWRQPERALWTAVYMGSTDYIEDFHGVPVALQSVQEHERCLVTVASMSALHLMSLCKLARVVFFDVNINEFYKLELVFQHIQET